MLRIISLEQIKSLISPAAVVDAMAAGFAMYHAGRVVVPPVGHLAFTAPPGDVHIKYGYIRDDSVYVIKIASGFYENTALGLPNNDGCMIVYSQQTGQMLAILLDEGYLTDIRTAAAGALAARYLAPSDVQCIGIVGAGVQARYQLEMLREVTACRKVLVWGRHAERLARYQAEMSDQGFDVATTRNLADVPATCNLIVTATPASAPLLMVSQIRPGTHITALGADGQGKQELDAAILAKADLVVVDSLSQCAAYGELSHALKAGYLLEEDALTLGALASGEATGRSHPDQITLADLTGVAVQDIQIAKMVYEALR